MDRTILVALTLASLITGCASIDNQNATKQQKTAEGAGIGAGIGLVVGNLLGVDARVTTALGAFIGGFVEYDRASKLELESAKKEAEALQQKGIESQVQTAEVEVKDDKGQPHKTTQLTSFGTHDLSNDSAIAVASVADKSEFGGNIVVVAEAEDQRRIQGMIKSITQRKGVNTDFFLPKDVRKYQSKPGIAWIPTRHIVSANS